MATSDAETTCEGSVSPKKQKVDDDKDENCPICWSHLSERSSTTLGCKHIFHLDCIGSEFNILGCMQCPTCRQIDPNGNWRFWDNKLPANALVRRVPNPSVPLQSGSFGPSRGLVDLLAHDLADAAVDNGISTGYEEWMYAYRTIASQVWSDMVGGNTPDSESSGLQNLVGVPQLDASESQRRERVIRDVSSLDIAAIPGRDPSRTSSSSENPIDSLLFPFDPNHTTIRRRGSRMGPYDAVSTQVQGQHAANFNAATGPALNRRVRQEMLGVSTAAEGQQRTQGWRTHAVTYEQELELQAIRQANEARASFIREARERLTSFMRQEESGAQLCLDVEGEALAARAQGSAGAAARAQGSAGALNPESS